MKEDWIDEMKHKLDDHKMEPPTGLWEDISRQMGLSPEPVRQPATKKRWYWAIAAGILVLVGFFAYYQPQEQKAGQEQKQPKVLAKEAKPELLAKEAPSMTNEPSTIYGNVVGSATPRPCRGKSTGRRASFGNEVPGRRGGDSNDTNPQQPQEIQTPPPTPPLEGRGVTEPSKADASQTLDEPQQTEILFSERTHSRPNKWSVGVNASGGLLAANTSQRTDYQYSILGGTSAYNSNTQSNYTQTIFVSEHHLPIRFGLSLHYQLAPRLALNSGINYTYLYSKFSTPRDGDAAYVQKLHYLGIPLGVTWQLWSVSHFRFYVSGGAMLEKCVSAQLEGSGSVREKPWQWSVEAAVGAEYTIIPQLGLYFEPSLGYYFDDGTSVEHYYKEHPLAPTIEFGLRLNLNSSPR